MKILIVSEMSLPYALIAWPLGFMTSRTLLAHHWFFEPRGGERVLAERRSFHRDLADANRQLVSDAGLAKMLALETVEPGRSGVMFGEATVDAVIEAIGQARATAWDPNGMLASAQRFGMIRFRDEITGWLGSS